MPPPPDLDALLAHAGWIRSLAKSLVADADRADDLVQRTFVAALEHPPGPVPLRRWLAAVLRNFARQDRRADRRRAERELAAARAEATPSARDAVEAIALQRALFEAVLALDEPYRATVVARYYDGLPPREIARQHSVPVKTVKTRLARGLEKLRAALDRAHGGDHRAWLPAMIPLAVRPHPSASTLWTLLVSTKIKIAAALAVVLIGALVWTAGTRVGTPPRHPALASDPEARPLETADQALVAATASRERERVEVPSIETESAHTATTAPEGDLRARGRVVDVELRPVGGVALCWQRDAKDGVTAAVSAPDGSFAVPPTTGIGALVACGPEWTTLFGAELVWAEAQAGLVVVVAPRGELAGIVVDSEGEPVPGAEVSTRIGREALKDLEQVTDFSAEIPRAALTDSEGRFEIPDAPATAKAVLRARAIGHEDWSAPAPSRPIHDLRIVLRRDEGVSVVRGEVLDRAGAPVDGALVACGNSTTRTDGDGRFVLEQGYSELRDGVAHPPREIVALEKGYLTSRLPKPRDGWPAFVTLRLAGEALSIRGRVVDSEGKGLAEIDVRALDEERFGEVSEGPGQRADWRTTESLLRGHGVDDRVLSDRDGEFVLLGLQPRSYRLGFLDKATLLAVQLDPVPAGRSDVLARMPGEDSLAPVAGRVVSTAGKPVPGVHVSAVRTIPAASSAQEPWQAWDSRSASTDVDGRFDLGLLPPEGLWLQVSGGAIDLLFAWRPPPHARLDALEIPVSLRCHIQIDLGGRSDLADSFQVLDETGEPLTLTRWAGSLFSTHASFSIQNGRSDVVAVPDTGRTIVVRKGETEVLREPVDLVPGDVVVVRL